MRRWSGPEELTIQSSRSWHSLEGSSHAWRALRATTSQLPFGDQAYAMFDVVLALATVVTLFVRTSRILRSGGCAADVQECDLRVIRRPAWIAARDANRT